MPAEDTASRSGRERDSVLSVNSVKIAVEVDCLRWRWRSSPDRGVGPLSFAVLASEVVCIVGPNGAGKSTLLRLIAGLLGPYDGTIKLFEKNLKTLDPRERARNVAWLPQGETVAFETTVREYVSLGRAPYTNWLGSLGSVDRRAVDQTLEKVGLTALASRSYSTLSGGEQRRCGLARALAQGAEILLLDEPLASLDLRHQSALCGLVRECALAGSAVVAVVHELTVAAGLADRILMLKNGELVTVGPTQDVMTPARLAEVFDTEVACGTLDGGGVCYAPRW